MLSLRLKANAPAPANAVASAANPVLDVDGRSAPDGTTKVTVER